MTCSAPPADASCRSTSAPIEIRKRVGLRLTAPVTRGNDTRLFVSIDALLEPFQAFVDGRTALETSTGTRWTGRRGRFQRRSGSIPTGGARNQGSGHRTAGRH
jgi:hypothetical protein